MNSQNIRNLQEAYFDVYQNLDERVLGQDPESRKEDSKERKSGSKRLPPSSGEKYAKTQSQLISFIDKLTKNKKIIPGMSSEEFDVILEYLLDEGYADTQEAALAIMGNMSEDWRESIVEEMFNEELTGERRKRAIKLGYKELATGKEGSRTTENPDKNLPTKRSGGGVRRNPEWSNPGQSLGAAKVDVTGKKESDRGSGNKTARRAGKKVKDNEDRYYSNDEDPDF